MTATPAESREELEKLERKHAENPEGRYFVPLANAYRKAGELDRAMRLLREGLERHPDYLSAHIVLGRCLADRGDGPGADAEFRYVLSLDPQNLIALRTLGELAIASGKRDEARSWYGDLLAVDPMNEDARRALEAIERAPVVEDLETAELGDRPANQVPLADAVRSGDTPASNQEFGESFGAMIDLDGTAEGDAPFAEEADAVVTETIAELYTRQGFYHRAADVYRELIRRRGGDTALEERLRRVEELAAGADEPPRPGSPSAEPAARVPARDEPASEMPLTLDADEAAWGAGVGWLSLPETGTDAGFGREEDAGWAIGSHDEEDADLRSAGMGDNPAGDPFADSFRDGFPALDDAGKAVEVGDEAEVAPSGGAGARGQSIREVLRTVVAWAPSHAATPEGGHAPVPAPIAPEEEPVEGLESPAERFGDFLDDLDYRDEAATRDTSFLGDMSFLDDEVDRTDAGYPGKTSTFEGAGPAGLDEEAAPAVPPAGREETARPSPPRSLRDDLFPWEIPEGTDDPLVSDRPAVEPLALDQGYPFDVAPDERALEAPHAPEPVEPESTAMAEDSGGHGAPVEPPPAAAALPPTPAAPALREEPEPRPAAPEPQDDDDLESFQAWLRSLKH